jgi:hypothetical protein
MRGAGPVLWWKKMEARLRRLRESHHMQIIHCCRRARRWKMVRWVKDVSRKEVRRLHQEAVHVVVVEGVIELFLYA